MNIVYREHLDSVIVFIDNILANSRTKEDQVERLKICLRKVEK